jgi:diguanylate cyclase (GGDEF)-like protein
MKRLVGILIVIVGFALTLPATASDLIISRGVLEDATGTLTIADVAGRVTSPAGPTLGMNSTDAAHWLCLRVRAPANGSQVVLFIRPTYLNEVRLYEAGSGNPLTWKTRVTGNNYPFGDRDRTSISLGFVVDVAAPEATYYLRLKTRSSAQFTVEALEPVEAESKDHQRDLVEVFFVTAMLCLLFWAILSYLLDRLPVVGLFAVHQAVYTLFGIVVTGYLAPLSPASFPKLVDWVNAILYLAINFTTLLFCRELFKPYKPPPVLMRGLKLLLWTYPVLLLALALGYNAFAINTNAALIKITWLYFVVIAFALRAESTPNRRLVRAFFVLVLMSNALFWIVNRNSRIASRINLSATQQLIVDGLIIGGSFAMMLHARARLARQEAQEAALNLLLVQKKLEIEQDLKNQAELQAQTDYLTGQPNRRRFVELAERELSRAIRFQRPFTLLMIDIDHFKAINDTWGHSAGDTVLHKVAHLIRSTLRDEDVFGRTGGEEFAAVIVEAERNSAIEVAQRLCSTVADAMIVQPETGRIQTTLSIGLAQLNGRNIPFASLLDEADRAMYDAKQAGRNRLAVCK